MVNKKSGALTRKLRKFSLIRKKILKRKKKQPQYISQQQQGSSSKIIRGKGSSSSSNKPTTSNSGAGGAGSGKPQKEQVFEWGNLKPGTQAPSWVPNQLKESWAFVKMGQVMVTSAEDVLLGAAQGKGVIFPGSNYIGPLNEVGEGAPPPTSQMDDLARIHDIQYGMLIDQGVDAYFTFNQADVYMLEHADLTTVEGQAINLFIGAKKYLFKPENTPVEPVPTYLEYQANLKNNPEAKKQQEESLMKEEKKLMGEDQENQSAAQTKKREIMNGLLLDFVTKAQTKGGVKELVQIAGRHHNQLKPVQNLESLRFLSGGLPGAEEPSKGARDLWTLNGNVEKKSSSVSSVSRSYSQSLSAKPLIFTR